MLENKTSLEKIKIRLDELLEDTFPLKRFLVALTTADIVMPKKDMIDSCQLLDDIKSLEKEARKFKRIAEKGIEIEKARYE